MSATTSVTHLVELVSVDVSVAVSVGDVPVIEAYGGTPTVVRRIVGAEVDAGRNRLVVVVARPEEAAPRLDATPDPRVRVALHRLAAGDRVNARSRVLDVTWGPEQFALPAAGTTVLVDHHFGGAAPPGGAPWAGADVQRPEHRPALLGWVLELHQAIGERDAARALTLLEGTTQRRALADGVDGDEAVRALAGELEAVLDDPALALEPLHPPTLVFGTARGGRLAVVRDHRGRPAIRARQTRGWWTRTPVLSISAGQVTAWR